MVGRVDRVSVSRAAAFLLLTAFIMVLCAAPAAGAAPRAVFAPPPQSSAPLAPSAGSPTTREGHALGAVAGPVETQARGSSIARAAGAELPSSYDLREHDKLTPVRDQDPYGTCWTFATMGALESFLMPGESTDFSEDNLVNYSGFTSSDNYQSGGNYWMSLAYLLRGAGPKTEAADPYPSPELTRGATTRKEGAGRGADPSEESGRLGRPREDRAHALRRGGHIHVLG